MEVYRTEEEQVEALKRWWDENGRSVVIGVVLALAAVFGWRAWQDHVRGQSDAASNEYQILLDRMNAGEGREVTDIGRRIIGQYPTTPYAVLASLALAQQAVDQNDLDGAAAHLRWAMEHSELPEVQHLAKVRMARLLIAQQRPEQALQELSGDAGSFGGLYEEARGDAYLALGKRSEAAQAYSNALGSYSDVPAKQQLLRMKLDDLADAEVIKQ